MIYDLIFTRITFFDRRVILNDVAKHFCECDIDIAGKNIVNTPGNMVRFSGNVRVFQSTMGICGVEHVIHVELFVFFFH